MTDYTPWEAIPGTKHHGPYVVTEGSMAVCDLYYMAGSKIVTFPDADEHLELIASTPRLKQERDELLEALKDMLGLHGEGYFYARTPQELEVMTKARALIERMEK